MSEALTPRQEEVLQLIAAGLSNGEIAEKLYLSEGTVKNTVSEIYARLGVRTGAGRAQDVGQGRRRRRAGQRPVIWTPKEEAGP